jgi:dTDP-4-dehydrorhamnose reductase
LLTFSSDLVFDGQTCRPYVESDGVAPLSVFGRSMADAERQVAQAMPTALIVRTGALFGPWDQRNFLTTALSALAAGRPFQAADDITVSPTYIPDLVHASLDLLIDREAGLWHLSNPGAVTWDSLARSVAELALLDPSLVQGCALSTLEFAARRPRYSVLGSERGSLLPSLEDALVRFLRDSGVQYVSRISAPKRRQHAQQAACIT